MQTEDLSDRQLLQAYDEDRRLAAELEAKAKVYRDHAEEVSGALMGRGYRLERGWWVK